MKKYRDDFLPSPFPSPCHVHCKSFTGAPFLLSINPSPKFASREKEKKNTSSNRTNAPSDRSSKVIYIPHGYQSPPTIQQSHARLLLLREIAALQIPGHARQPHGQPIQVFTHVHLTSESRPTPFPLALHPLLGGGSAEKTHVSVRPNARSSISFSSSLGSGMRSYISSFSTMTWQVEQAADPPQAPVRIGRVSDMPLPPPLYPSRPDLPSISRSFACAMSRRLSPAAT